MTPERWQTIKHILEAALELPPDSRHDFIQQTCSDDDALLREVESLLVYEESGADLLDASAFSIVSGGEPAEISDNFIGRRIGRYSVISELGAGGMGTVFLAQRADGEFDHQVALKLIKSGLGSESIVRRFYSERQILASLDHPNIARLIDGGTTEDGLPYFVMEYVRGQTIIDFAQRREFSLEQRLDLFREVCAAVSYAHQNLVIHRDLKPSNILVNTEGAPKLLDFGIAKLLRAENSAQTATQHFAFTPEYASPEQISGEKLTTATDVYSLGVILYELLTGARPFSFEGKNFGQIMQTVTKSAPIRPSGVVAPMAHAGANPLRSLDGDLDNITLKALTKEPERRYTTVEQFSEDIRRYLRGLPVIARPDTWGYRVQKFARRDPLLAGAGALSFLILVGGITATTYQARQANKEREVAERRFADIRNLANSFIFEVNEMIDESPIKARELLVNRAVEYLNRLAAEADGDPGLQAELANGYEKIGDIQAKYFGSGTGDTAGALQNHKKALDIRERLSAAAPADQRYSLNLSNSHLKIADLSVTAGRMPTALENYDKAIAVIESVQRNHPDNLDVKRELARANAKLGQGILRSGSISLSLEKYEKAASLISEVSAADPSDPRLLHTVSVYESYLGYAKLEMGRVEEAFAHFSESLRIEDSIWQANKESVQILRDLASAELWAGIALRHLHRFDESRLHQQKATEIQKDIYDRDKSNVGDKNSLADCYLELGWTYSDSGHPEAAVGYFDKALVLYGEVAKNDVNNLSALRQIAFTHIRLGDALARSGNSGLATQAYEKALAESEAINKKDGSNSEFRYDKAVCLLRLAERGLNAAGNTNKAIQILEQLVSESPEHKQRQADLEHARDLLAKLS